MSDPHVVYVHWEQPELAERVERLGALGYNIGAFCDDASSWRDAFEGPELPAAVVIDLGQRPRDGQAIASWLHDRPQTAELPLVFVDGDSDLDAVRELFPDALACHWADIATTLASVAAPRPDPYRTRTIERPPLWQVLGLASGGVLALIDKPKNFEPGEMPEGVFVKREARGVADRIILFARQRMALERRLITVKLLRRDEDSVLLIAWPKSTAECETDLSDESVRAVGRHIGLFDGPTMVLDDHWMAVPFGHDVDWASTS